MSRHGRGAMAFPIYEDTEVDESRDGAVVEGGSDPADDTENVEQAKPECHRVTPNNRGKGKFGRTKRGGKTRRAPVSNVSNTDASNADVSNADAPNADDAQSSSTASNAPPELSLAQLKRKLRQAEETKENNRQKIAALKLQVKGMEGELKKIDKVHQAKLAKIKKSYADTTTKLQAEIEKRDQKIKSLCLQNRQDRKAGNEVSYVCQLNN